MRHARRWTVWAVSFEEVVGCPSARPRGLSNYLVYYWVIVCDFPQQITIYCACVVGVLSFRWNANHPVWFGAQSVGGSPYMPPPLAFFHGGCLEPDTPLFFVLVASVKILFYHRPLQPRNRKFGLSAWLAFVCVLRFLCGTQRGGQGGTTGSYSA